MIRKKKNSPRKKSYSAIVSSSIAGGVYLSILLMTILLQKFAWGNAACLIFLLAISFGWGFSFLLFKFFSANLFLSLGLNLALVIASFFYIPFKSVKCTNFMKLDEVINSAKLLDDKKIEMDNKDLLKPVYDSYYKKIAKSSFQRRLLRILQFMRISKKPLFEDTEFPCLLSEVIAQQRKQNLPAEDFIIKTKLSEEGKAIVFGDLQGAFPSLARNLAELNKQGIIDENLKLKNPKDFLVLTGDALSRSPFQLELLSVLLRLYSCNPDQFIYLKGHHETASYWQEFSLKQELTLRIGSFLESPDKNKAPLEKEIELFLSSLPMGIYFELPLDEQKKEQEFIRITHYAGEESNFFGKDDEKRITKFLEKPATSQLEVATLKSILEQEPGKELKLKAIIRSEKKRESYQEMDGLRLLAPENGVPAWTLISCPTEVYQKGLKFFFDAFAIVNLDKKDIKDSNLTLFKQDVRSSKGFESRTVNIFTAATKDQEKATQDNKPKTPVTKEAEKETVLVDQAKDSSNSSKDKLASAPNEQGA